MLALITAVVALFIGFGLGQIGEIFKNKQINRKSYNTLLFNLLLIRRSAKNELISNEKLAIIYSERLNMKITNYYNSLKGTHEVGTLENLNNKLNEAEKKLKSNLFNRPENIEAYKGFEKQIKDIIPKISEIDPVLAYKINGNYIITNKLNNIKDRAHLKQDIHKIILFDNFLLNLEKIILVVMSCCDKKHKNRALDILKKEDTFNINKIDFMIDSMLLEHSKKIDKHKL